jgi:hypothetical protein
VAALLRTVGVSCSAGPPTCVCKPPLCMWRKLPERVPEAGPDSSGWVAGCGHSGRAATCDEASGGPSPAAVAAAAAASVASVVDGCVTAVPSTPHEAAWLVRSLSQSKLGSAASVGCKSRWRVLRPLAVGRADRRLRRCEGAICLGSHVRLYMTEVQIAYLDLRY